jgi:hypothetical protein
MWLSGFLLTPHSGYPSFTTKPRQPTIPKTTLISTMDFARWNAVETRSWKRNAIDYKAENDCSGTIAMPDNSPPLTNDPANLS